MCMNVEAAEKLPRNMATCLCNLHFKLHPEHRWLPEWGYNAASKTLILYCPNCKYQVGPVENRNAAIASWSLLNRSGDEQVSSNWSRDYTLNYETPEHLKKYENNRKH